MSIETVGVIVLFLTTCMNKCKAPWTLYNWICGEQAFDILQLKKQSQRSLNCQELYHAQLWVLAHLTILWRRSVA